MKKGGYVYLLSESDNEGIYKIGVTRGSIENRIKALQTGNSNEISIRKYYKTEMPFLLEKKLHEHHIGSKISGEWYLLTDDEVLNFENECSDLEKMINSLSDNPFVKAKIGGI